MHVLPVPAVQSLSDGAEAGQAGTGKSSPPWCSLLQREQQHEACLKGRSLTVIPEACNLLFAAFFLTDTLNVSRKRLAESFPVPWKLFHLVYQVELAPATCWGSSGSVHCCSPGLHDLPGQGAPHSRGRITPSVLQTPGVLY